MKRLTSLILVLLMLMSAMSFSTMTASAAYDPEGLAFLPENQRTIELFNKIGIAKNFLANYDDKSFMTRREFCVLMNDFLGASSKTSSTNLIKFEDVLDYDKDINILRNMSDLGFMDGFSDNLFRPDDKVTYEDAITLMINMVGYKYSAQARGGYPMGYLAVASSSGLLDGVKPVSGEPIPQDEILCLLTNFIEIDVLEQVSFGTEVKYQAIEGETILAKNFNIYKGDGIVDGTYETMLDNNSLIPEDRVSIDGSQLLINGTNVEKYFGYNVDYYYTLNESGYSKLVSVYPSDLNKELVIDVADKGYFDGSDLIYYVDGSNKEHKAEIEIGTMTVYNGVAAPFNKQLIEDMQEGYLKFVDNNGDRKYDILFVEEIKYFVVRSVDKINEVIYGKYTLESGDNILRLDDDTYDVKYSIVDTNGAPFDLKNIKEWDVLSVSAATISSDKVIKITVCSSSVSGKLTAIAGVYGDYDYIVVNDTEYKVSNTMNALILEGQVNDFKLGQELTVIFNANGRAVCTKQDSKFSGKLGVLKDYGYLTVSNKEYYIEYVDDAGAFTTAYLAPIFKFKYADSSVEIDDKIEVRIPAEFSVFTDIIETVYSADRRVFRYELDSEGRISEVEFATDATSNKSLLGKNRLSIVKKTATEQYRIYKNLFFENSNRMTTGKLYRLASGATIFTTPYSGMDDDSLYATYTDFSEYMERRTTDSNGYITYKFTGGQFYCYGEFERDLVAVVYQDSGLQLRDYTTSSNALIVSKVTTVEQEIDGERETLIKLTGITGNGKEDSVLVRDLRSAADIASTPLKFSFGDIIMVKKGKDGFATFRNNAAVTYMDDAYNTTRFVDNGVPLLRIVKTTAPGNNAGRATFTRTTSSDMQVNSGRVAYLAYAIDIADGVMYLGHYTDTNIDGSSDKFDAPKSYGLGSEKVYVIDSKKKEIKKGTIDDVITVDKKFPEDRNSAHAHDDATVMFTIANVNNIEYLFIFK